MRRTSLVAPLLLIVLGALLLARTLYPELQLMDYISRFWPLALIAWGGLRISWAHRCGSGWVPPGQRRHGPYEMAMQ